MNEVEKCVRERHSVRAFLDKPVPVETIKEILDCAKWAPSGTNTQPWEIHVVGGKLKEQISAKVKEAYYGALEGSIPKDEYVEYYDYYPSEWVSPFIDRRRKNGWDLYGLLGIEKGDKEKMTKQHVRNYDFFDAPIALFVTTKKVMGNGAKIDIGMFMQNIMLVAKSKGLDTCPMAAMNQYHKIVLPLVGGKEDDVLISTIALGYADESAVVNTLKTVREDVDVFTKWHLD